MPISDYMSDLNKRKMIPKDAYGHASLLIDTDQEEKHYDNLASKQVLLSFINDDRLLQLYQRDVVLLDYMYALGQADPIMKEIFNVLYHGWQAELGITRTKDGMERQLQARTSGGQTGYNPDFTGYGQDLPMWKEEEKKPNPLVNVLSKLGRRSRGSR